MKKIISILLLMSLLLSSIAFAESATSQLQEMYAQAELLMATGDYAGAAAKFEAMGAYSDASQMAMYCKAVAAAETLGMYDVAIEAFKNLGDFKDSKQMATYYDGRKNQATADYIIGEDITTVSDGDLETAEYAYNLASDTFAGLALFKDCLSRMSDCQTKGKAIEAEQEEREATSREDRYQEALALEQEGKYEEAIKIYKELGNYKDCPARITACNNGITENAYQMALSFVQEGKYEEAADLLKPIINYKDSYLQLKNCCLIIAKSMRISKEVTINYHQDKEASTVVSKYNYKKDGSYTIETLNNKTKSTINVDKNGKYLSGEEEGIWSEHKDDTYLDRIQFDNHNNRISVKRTFKAKSAKYKSLNGLVINTAIENAYNANGDVITQKVFDNGEYKRTYTFDYLYDENQKITGVTRIVKYSNGTQDETHIAYQYDEFYGYLIKKVYSDENDDIYSVIEYDYEKIE